MNQGMGEIRGRRRSKNQKNSGDHEKRDEDDQVTGNDVDKEAMDGEYHRKHVIVEFKNHGLVEIMNQRMTEIMNQRMTEIMNQRMAEIMNRRMSEIIN